ncbi:MAG TPA: aconitate hydratase [Frankiaceae bacterium]|nr:aconitate hydratase [Frankiaceae bacterium]
MSDGLFTPVELVEALYDRLPERVATARRRLGRPVTYAEKVLFAHLRDPETAGVERGTDYAEYQPDRVALQDATAQMALLQFMTARLPRVAVPTTVHCDHLIQAEHDATRDLLTANEAHREVYEFLRSASAKYGIGFWAPGSGIIHQVVLEHYAFPGGLMLGTDSHTPNAGGLGMAGIGVGGADAVDVLTGRPFGVRVPRLVGVRLTGELNGWASAKDVILTLAGLLTVKGGTGAVVEYFGPGARTLSCIGKATICNMGAELGATTSVFPYDAKMAAYLAATGRADLAALADGVAEHLRADDDVEVHPERYFDRVVELDLSTVEPHVTGPHTPDLTRPVSRVAADAAAHDYPVAFTAALVGSCTNSSYEDMSRAAHVARQAAAHGVRARTPLLVTPGSEQVRATIARDGQLAALEDIGATVLANACGPCIGQWQRTDLPPGTRNSILNTYNRNFPKRNDGRAETLSFIASPELVVAQALAGRLDFNPMTDPLVGQNGEAFLLAPPVAPELPESFDPGESGYVAPPADGSAVEVVVHPGSERLQVLEPFPAWDGADLLDCPVLLKAAGKCTTDSISPAGPWLRFRGHLDRISDNLFSGAVDAFTGETGRGVNALTGATEPFAGIARDYQRKGLRWVAVGDENYGEGSSREHAAMEPRYLGGVAILARSFARIHETNLKKQGVLPLTFADPASYDLIRAGDRLDVLALAGLAPGRPVTIVVRHADGTSDTVETTHTLSAEHVAWFRAGSSLNVLTGR